jgi:hypothetical protein
MDGGNPALERTLSRGRPGIGPLRFSFDGPRTRRDARQDARDGWWVAAWYFVGYGVFAVFFVPLFMRYGGFAVAALAINLAILVSLLILAVVLAYAIRQKQPRWASVALLVWTLYECVNTGLPLLHGRLNFSLPLNLYWVLVAARSVRGAFKLASFRRGALTLAQAQQVFE